MARKPDIIYVNYYTDGSAARKVAPSVPVREDVRVAKRRPQKRKAIYVDPVAILGLVVAVSMLVMMVVGLVQFQDAKISMERMEGYVNELDLQTQLLQIRYDANVDLEHVEKTALALGMVPADQVQTMPISVSVPELPAPTVIQSPWEQIVSFLTSFFA